jgi:hypothetical protein
MAKLHGERPAATLSMPVPHRTGVEFHHARFGAARLRGHEKETAMIKKVSGGYQVLSSDGKKNLGGPYKTKEEALKRLRQVEFFKHKKG